MLETPPIERIEHASAHGRWTLWRRRPAAPLRRWLVEYQGYVEVGGRPVRRRELPGTVVPLILNLGEPFWAHEIGRPARADRLPRAFTAGLWERPALVGSGGSAHCLQVDLTPLAARRLFGVPMAELTGRTVDVDDLTGGWGGRLLDRLAALRHWPDRFQLLDAAFAARLAAGAPTPPLVAAAWARLETAPVGVIARELETSRALLHRLFLDQLGLPAKTVARLRRFERALAGVAVGRPLAAVAADAGYFDQPHFNREVRAFTGESPTALRRRILADGTGVLDDAL